MQNALDLKKTLEENLSLKDQDLIPFPILLKQFIQKGGKDNAAEVDGKDNTAEADIMTSQSIVRQSNIAPLSQTAHLVAMLDNTAALEQRNAELQ